MNEVLLVRLELIEHLHKLAGLHHTSFAATVPSTMSCSRCVIRLDDALRINKGGQVVTEQHDESNQPRM